MCNCMKSGPKEAKFQATFSDGSKQTFSSETAAAVAVAKKGGAYKKVS